MPRMSEDPMSCDDIISIIKSQADPKAIAGMAKVGINVTRAYGIFYTCS